jgi:hypothetical protein
MPGKADDLWSSLGAPGSPSDAKFAGLDSLDPTGWKVAKGASLFPKAEPK